MGTNENYEELKQTTKTFLQLMTNNDLYYGLALFVIMVVLYKLVDVVFLPFRRRNSMLVTFTKAVLKVTLLVTFGMRIISMIPFLQDFASQILMSSSLIVVVLGFVFQEGLTNIVHGFIISVFHPFKIGDRITVTVDGENITGYVQAITARHTVLQNVVNSACVIVPNAKMDMSVVNNSYFDKSSLSTNFLDLEITYESNLEKALALIAQAVEKHPLVAAARTAKQITDPVTVMVRELTKDGVSIRAIVVTQTVEENFAACSDIRRYLVHCFTEDPELEFAYPHLQLVDEFSAGSGTSAELLQNRYKTGARPPRAGHTAGAAPKQTGLPAGEKPLQPESGREPEGLDRIPGGEDKPEAGYPAETEHES